VESRQLFLRLAHAAMVGTLFLAGCPSAQDYDDSTVVASIVAEGSATTPNTAVDPNNKEALVAKVIDLVNQERTKRGLPAVTSSPVLTRMADDYAKDMGERGFFGHYDPDNKDVAQRAIEHGYVFLAVGENLAGGQNSPEGVMDDWMNSTEGHRENILSAQWTEVGVSVRLGGTYGIYWVQEFGNPP